ncbi:hypothetical protein GOBAR_DD14706 [Gossypium barbadense]|nr:hypothetical protein GOBAR_DD14706 [Gossypium barbadense]
MKHHTDLANRKFDRIIFNFPHAGFHGKEDNPHMIRGSLKGHIFIPMSRNVSGSSYLWYIPNLRCDIDACIQASRDHMMHRNLVQGFFRSARGMLRANSEIHVNHKTNTPFSLWNLKKLASGCSPALIQRVDFNVEDYPGYHNKRGDGSRCDEPFPLGKSCIFKFGFCPRAKKASKATKRWANSLRSDFDARYDGLGSLRHGLDRQLVEVPRTLNGNLPYMHEHKHEHERVRHGLDRQVVGVPRTINDNLYYMYEHEQAKHSLDRQKVEVPGTLHGNLYYMHQHENSLDRRMIEMPRTLNGNSYYMHEHKPARHVLTDKW